MPKTFEIDNLKGLVINDGLTQWNLSAKQIEKHLPMFNAEMTKADRDKVNLTVEAVKVSQ
ncbi:MAG: hypothetical protein V4605_08870 [Pseudomonadota bacterium]